MKTATVADLRNHFPRISAYIESGQTVEITRRGRHFATLVPSRRKPKLVKPDIMARLRETWGDQMISARQAKEFREPEREFKRG